MEKKLKNEILVQISKGAPYNSNYAYRSVTARCYVIFYNHDTKRAECVDSDWKNEFIKTEKGLVLEEAIRYEKNGNTSYFHPNSYWERHRAVYLNHTIEDFKKDFPYSGIEKLIADGLEDFWCYMYINLYVENPTAEQIYKIAPQLVNAGIKDKQIFNRCFNKNGKNMKEISKLPDWLWKKMVKEQVKLPTWNFIRIWYKQSEKDGTPLEVEDIESLIDMSENGSSKCLTSFKYIIKNAVDDKGKALFTIPKLNKYLDRVDMYQAIPKYMAIEILKDYIHMCQEMNIVPVTDSNSLKREHDVTARIHSDFASKKRYAEAEEKFKEVYPELEKYAYEDDELKVIVPHTPNDMIDEARMNHNCMSSYIDFFAKGKSKIFFIRKKNDLEKSYISVELNSTLCDYRQAYYACNQPVTKKSDLAFIKNWLENNKKLRLQTV